MSEDLDEIARHRALRLMAETLLRTALDPQLPESTLTTIGDAALDVLLEIRDRPIGVERHVQLLGRCRVICDGDGVTRLGGLWKGFRAACVGGWPSPCAI